MKIAIDLTPAYYHLTGIERFALCITEEMIKQDNNNEYILIFKDKIHKNFAYIVDEKRIKSVILHGKNKLFFYQVNLLKSLYRIKADRYLFLAFPAPILFKNKFLYNTLHDMGRWDYDDDRLIHKVYFRTLDIAAAKHSNKIFTVSNFSKNRLNSILHYPLDDIVVTYNGVTSSITDSNDNFLEVKEKYGLPKQYIMYLSTLQPRKNLKLLLEAYSEISNEVNYGLVLIGRNGWQTNELMEKYNQNNRIIFTGFVEDKDIASVYKNAICFVFPTLYEGFGIPTIEALAMGTPVISSDSSCMPEILMDRALYFKNNSKEELKQLLLRLPEISEDIPHSLNEFQVNNYSYVKSARKILEILTKED